MTPRKTNRRILSHEVGAVVAGLGRCTVDELQLEFPEYSRYQLQNALSAASRRGMVRCLQSGCRHGGSGVWEPTEKKVEAEPPQQAIPSVFHLASGPVLVPAWQQSVREHLLQGEW